MGEVQKAPATQVSETDPEDIPATSGGQGGTSQPGAPTDTNEPPPGEVDFSEPETGEGGTDRS